MEEQSGTITVVNEIGKFRRRIFNFQAVVDNGTGVILVTNVTVKVVEAIANEGTFFHK